METLARRPPRRIDADLGVRVTLAWLLLMLGLNLVMSSSLVGLLTVTPFLAATLVDRPRRVLAAGVLALVCFVLVVEIKNRPWDGLQQVRLAGIVFATAVATVASRARLRERRSMVDVTEVARAVQTAVMRLHTPATDTASTSLQYRAADVQALIGGDALEAVETRWGVRFLVADARGKGLASLRASTTTLGAFREWAHVEEDLDQLLARLHRSLARELDEDDYVTALVAQLDGLELTFASAGHPMPLLVRQHRVTELRARPTTPLAMKVPHPAAETGSITLMAGDVVLMVTDGLLEARDGSGRFFPVDVLAAECMSVPDVAVGVSRLIDAAAEFTAGGRLTDDIAIAAIRVDDGHRARG